MLAHRLLPFQWRLGCSSIAPTDEELLLASKLLKRQLRRSEQTPARWEALCESENDLFELQALVLAIVRNVRERRRIDTIYEERIATLVSEIIGQAVGSKSHV